MKEIVLNFFWGLGVKILHTGKRLGISGPFEHFIDISASEIFRVPQNEQRVIIPGGLKMIVPPNFPRSRTYASGSYEPEVTTLFEKIVKQGMNVIDVGAFCGYYSLITSRLVGSSGKIFSFEADPLNYKYLVNNLSINGCTNTQAVNQAISNKKGTMSIDVKESADHKRLLPTSKADAAIIETTTLDDYFKSVNWPTIDLIKMDIEGAEQMALEGMIWLSKKNPNLRIIMEYDLNNLSFFEADEKSLDSTLLKLGFKTAFMIEQRMKAYQLSSGLPKTKATYNLLVTKN